MKMRRFKQLLAVSFAIAALCTNTAFAAEQTENNTTKEVIKEELAVNPTNQNSKGEQTLPTKEQLAEVKEEKTGSIAIQLTDGKAGSSKNGIRFSFIIGRGYHRRN